MPSEPTDETIRTALTHELEQQLQENLALLRVSQALASSTDVSHTLQVIVDSVISVIHAAQQAVIHLLDEEAQTLRAVAVANPQYGQLSNEIRLSLGRGIAGLVIISGETIYVPDVTADERFLFGDKSPQNLHSLLVAPLRAMDRVIGTISVSAAASGAFAERDNRLLTILGAQAAVALERAKLLNQEREQRLLAETLLNTGANLGTWLSLDDVLDHLLDQARLVLPYTSANILMVEGEHALMVRQRGYEQMDLAQRARIAAIRYEIDKMPYIAQMAETSEPAVVSDTTADPNWARTSTSDYIQSWVGAPILVQGQSVAFISLNSSEKGYYNLEHARRLSAFAGQASLVLQNARLFDTIRNRLDQANLLYNIGQVIVQSLDLERLVEKTTQLLRDHFHYPYIQITLDGSPSAHPAAIEDAGLINLTIPLQVGERHYGSLSIGHETPYAYSQEEVQLLTTVADQLALAMEKSRLYSDLQETLQKEQAARAQLVQSEKLAALGRITASVAHELNNPLQAIQNALYLIKTSEELTPQAGEDLQVALEESARMADLILRLRETYRPTSAEEFQPESLIVLINEIRRLINGHLQRNQVRFSLEAPTTLPSVPLIRDQMKQVILNLCLNAVEAMPQGGDLRLRLEVAPGERLVMLQVKDTGPGIDPSLLPNIFDPFFTTKDGGTGLGLAISHDIVRRHNGRIDVASQVGQGTIFTIWLPV